MIDLWVSYIHLQIHHFDITCRYAQAHEVNSLMFGHTHTRVLQARPSPRAPGPRAQNGLGSGRLCPLTNGPWAGPGSLCRYINFPTSISPRYYSAAAPRIIVSLPLPLSRHSCALFCLIHAADIRSGRHKPNSHGKN